MAENKTNILKPICLPAQLSKFDKETDRFYILHFNDWDAGLDEPLEFNTDLEKMKEDILKPKRSDKYDPNAVVISYDTEWQVKDDNRRHILSYQFTVYYNGQVKEYMFIPKTEEPLQLQDLFKEIGADFNLPICPKKGDPNNKIIPTYLLAHNLLCDITNLDDFSRIWKDLTGDREVFSKKPSRIYESGLKNNAYRTFDLSAVGTLNHYSGSLAKLGDSVGMPKVKLDDGVIEHMEDFRNNDFDKFCEYSMGDTRVIMKWYLKNFRDLDIPFTTTSLGEKLMIQSLGGQKEAEHLRGIQTKWEKVNYKKDGKDVSKNIKKEDYVTPLAKEIQESGRNTYLGGWNTCTEPGIFTEETFDFDLSGAYVSSAGTLPNIDFNAKNYKAELKNCDLTKSFTDKYPYNTIGFANIDFEFPSDVKYPCLPVSDKKGWIYARTGKDVDVTWPELKLAVEMGATIHVKELKLYEEERDPQTGKAVSTLGNAYKFFTENREAAKHEYGKGSPQEENAKLFGNGVYGKLSQGLKEKSIRDVASNEMKSVKTSSLTSPAHASHLTAMIRSSLCATMEELHRKGFDCVSVTTDGFISNASLQDVRNCEMFGLRDLLAESSKNLRGNDIVWEEKHHQPRLLNVSTRVNYGLDVSNHQVDKGVEASTGYTGDNFVKDYLSRGENGITLTTRIFPSLTKMVYDGKDYIPDELVKNLLTNYDFKRQVDLSTIKDMRVEYECQDYNVVNFDTKPYETIDDWLTVQKTMDRNKISLLTARDYEDVLAPKIELRENDLRSEILVGLYANIDGLKFSHAIDSIGENEFIKSVNTAARNLGCDLNLTPTLLHEIQTNNIYQPNDPEIVAIASDNTNTFIEKVETSLDKKLEKTRQLLEDDPQIEESDPDVSNGKF